MVNRIRVADYVINRLIESGVDHFFLVVGGNAMYLHDAIRISGISYTAFHHEQSATIAAEAYSRLSGKLSCVVVTSGPGASNIVTGVAGAFYDSVPVLVICGNSKSSDLRRVEMPIGVRQVGTFELPIHEVCKPISKYTALIPCVDQVQEILESAISACISGRAGPAVLNFPLDIQGSDIQIRKLPQITFCNEKKIKPLESAEDEITEMILNIQNSLRPAILVGHGVRASGESEKILEIIKNLNIPIFTTQLAKDFVPYDDNLFVGHVGVRGDRAGNVGIHESDFILCIGTSLHQQNIGYEPELFAPGAKKYILDFEGSVSGKKLPIDAIYLDMHISKFVSYFEKKVGDFNYKNNSWLKNLQNLKEMYQVQKEPHDLTQIPINLYEFVHSLSQNLQGGETIITDSGLCYYVMGQGFKLKKNQRYLVSGGLGSMGYALPAAIGVSINSNNTVIAVTGDGSMQMNVQELATLKLSKGKTKIFVINNGGYASLRNTQESFFGKPFIGSSESSGLMMPNWESISSAYGIDYVLINDSQDLPRTLAHVLENESVQLIEVVCQTIQNVMPRVGNYVDDSGKLRSNPLFEMIPQFPNKATQHTVIIK